MTEEYFKIIKSLLPKYREIISSNKMFDNHLLGFTNEAFLFDLMNECGWGEFIPVAENDEAMMSSLKGNRSFRPHHGVHLSIFKTGNYDASTRTLLDSETYCSYYKKMREAKNDIIYNNIEKYFTEEIKGLLANADSYYKSIEL